MLGVNSFTEIHNADSARIKGAETDISLRPDEHWTITGAAAYTDARLTADYCGVNDPATGLPVTVCPGPLDLIRPRRARARACR